MAGAANTGSGSGGVGRAPFRYAAYGASGSAGDVTRMTGTKTKGGVKQPVHTIGRDAGK